VASFADGQLTITLANGKSYDGQVTDRTTIRCSPAVPATPQIPATRGARRHGPPPAPTPSTTAPPSTTTPPVPVPASCGAADLVAGAQVTAARLTLSGDGATWKKVELLT
jgi:hypothetical protein